MIHILWVLLKAVGILLLVLLLLVLFLICVVLFVPVCYRMHVQKKEEGFACVKAQAKVSWLLGAVAFAVSYENQTPQMQVRIFGTEMETWKKRIRRMRRGSLRTAEEDGGVAGKDCEKTEAGKKEQKTENKPETEKKQERDSKWQTERKQQTESRQQIKQQHLETGNGITEEKQPENRKPKEQSAANPVDTLLDQVKESGKNEEPEKEPKKGILEKAGGIFAAFLEKLFLVWEYLFRASFWILELPFRFLEGIGKKLQAGKRLRKKWQALQRFLHSEMFRQALFHARKELVYLLKKLAPKKVSGTVTFGFEDPALTGEMLGVLGMFYGKLPRKLSLNPVFEKEILQGELQMQGSFCLVTVAGIALRLFRDKNLRKTIQHFKHKEA